MRTISLLFIAAGALFGVSSIGAAAPAHASGCCAPAVVVYYTPPPCCPRYYGGHYYKTSQYWPAVRPYWMERHYWPVRARRR
jgi:hypothetical protein